jgi:hypothetical protein
MFENSKKTRRNCYFLQYNCIQGMFKSENVVVTNVTTHCKLKQDIKIVFQFKYLN